MGYICGYHISADTDMPTLPHSMQKLLNMPKITDRLIAWNFHKKPFAKFPSLDNLLFYRGTAFFHISGPPFLSGIYKSAKDLVRACCLCQRNQTPCYLIDS